MARGEWRNTTELISAASRILNKEAPMTIRQLFYRLVSAAIIPNDTKNYKRVSHIMTKARLDGRIPYQYIVDRSRPKYSPNVFDNPAEYAEAIKDSYRKDYWHSQPCYVELFVEKDAIIGSIERLTDELGITVRVGRGFNSTTKIHELAQHFRKISKPIFLFYLGDHDPSGQDIERDLYARLRDRGARFTGQRLAIFRDDITRYELPPLRVKDSDSRSSKFTETHGEDAVELDALPPDVLRSRIRGAVESKMDLELWERAKKVEAVERASILETVGKWINLPTVNPDISEFKGRDGAA